MNTQQFGKYQLLKKIATGGMAEVWLARHTGIEGFERNLVVKRILPHLADDPEFVQMFLNEAKIAARFNHPNIAQIYDLGEANGTFFIAMEFIHGEDLGRLMRKAWSTGQWIARPLAIRIVASCCEGLSYAHSKADDSGRPLKVVHRDISPQNILISFDGSVKLVDFGIAKAADQASLTKSGAIKGKFAYMAPEQAGGKPLDHRSDIFAIGLVLYELLTGVRPLKRETEIATLQAALECAIEAPSAVADVPSELDEVVMRAVAKSVDDRYANARLFQMALEEFLVSQRWVASSVQISELMATLFADRLAEEAKLGDVNPQASQSQSQSSGSLEAPGEISVTQPPSRAGKAPSGSRSPSAASDMEWEAPPGEFQEKSRVRAPARPALSEAPNRATPRALSEAPSRATPSLTNLPQRRPAEDDRVSNQTAIARTPSRSDLPRIRGATLPPPKPIDTRVGERDDDRDEDRQEPRGEQREGPRDLRAELERDESARQDRELEDQVEAEDNDRNRRPAPTKDRRAPRAAYDADLTAAPKVPPAKPRRPAASNLARAEPDDDLDDAEEEPERAPSALKKKRPLDEKKRRPKPAVRVVRDTAERYVDVDELRERSRKRFQRVFVGSLIAAGLLLIAIFHDPILKALTDTEAERESVQREQANHRSIFLDVEANQPVKVKAHHPVSEKASEPETDLGDAPLRHKEGAHVQDTIVLENSVAGIHWEQEIPYGQPGSTIEIKHTFGKGWLVFNFTPKSLDKIEIHENGQLRANYHPKLKQEFFEGAHTLVLEGEQLREPVKIEVVVKPGVDTSVDRDLSKWVEDATPMKKLKNPGGIEPQ